MCNTFRVINARDKFIIRLNLNNPPPLKRAVAADVHCNILLQYYIRRIKQLLL